MSRLKALYNRVRTTPLFSPGGFLLRAGLILLLYFVAHMAGFRDYVSVLSGTAPQGVLGQTVSSYLGIVYLLLYVAAVGIVPVLIVAALVFAVLERRLVR